MPRVRVMLVDDHAMIRAGMKLLIGGQSDLCVVAEAGTLRDAIAAAPAAAPDVITLDLSMPGGAGIAGVSRLRAAAPSARIVVLTMHDDPAYVRTAMALGASGFLVKSAADSELIGAIRAVAAGRVFVSVPTAGDLERVFGASAAQAQAPAPISTLSQREREVLAAVARGYTNQQVADQLGLSVKTVESYRARVMAKLNLKSRADLVRLAVEVGVLESEG